MTRRFVFIDTETTGLDPDRHELVEVAWAVDNGTVQRLVLPHEFVTPDPHALALNGYLDRRLFDRMTWAKPHEVDGLWDDLNGATVVGANPRFDCSFLTAYFTNAYKGAAKADPWHYRLLDVQAYGMAALRLEEMPGLADLVALLRRGYEIPESDHTATADVLATRAVFRAMQKEVAL